MFSLGFKLMNLGLYLFVVGVFCFVFDPLETIFEDVFVSDELLFVCKLCYWINSRSALHMYAHIPMDVKSGNKYGD